VNHFPSNRIAVTAGATVLLLATAGCVVESGSTGTVEQASRSINLQGAKSAQVEIEMGAGELKVHGGGATLMDADFRYRSSDGKPEINYTVSGDRGLLTLHQRSHHSIGNNDKNTWDLRLNDDVPLDINVKMGAGEGQMNLGNVALRSLEVEMGAGELKLDLTGHPRNDIDVRVRGGVGEATLRLPRRARLEVEAHGGLGEINAHGLTKRGDLWVNEPSGDAPTMHVNVTGGIGGINLYCE
jgi:N-terminal domain of toast_rack, DUF2154